MRGTPLLSRHVITGDENLNIFLLFVCLFNSYLNRLFLFRKSRLQYNQLSLTALKKIPYLLLFKNGQAKFSKH